MTREIHFVGITASDPADYRNFSSIAFGSLAAYLQKCLPGICFSLAENPQEALGLCPDIIGINSTSVNFGLAKQMAWEIKNEKDIPVLIGGIHISLLPKTLPESMDIGVIGEGEQTLFELLEIFCDEGKLLAENLRAVRGICFHEKNGVHVTEPRPLIQDLDTLCHPDRELMGVDPDRAHIVSSRGCPFDCSFCSSKAFWGSYRAHGAEYVLEEIRSLVEDFQVKQIHFYDDLFVADRKRLEKIAKQVVKAGYPERIEFSLALRAELADEKLFETLSAMGVTQVTFGAESNAPRVLKYLKGEKADVCANQRVVDLGHQFKIGVSPSFIKGSPEESGDELLETWRFIIENIREKKINYFELHNLTPFPGTKVWEEAKAGGLVHEEMDWEKLRRPWEELYLNRKMPKASFYFFETLNEQAKKMLGILKRELVCVFDRGGIRDTSAISGELEKDGFFDRIVWVDLEKGDHGELASLQENPERPFLFCYADESEAINLEAMKRFCWYGFLNNADYLVHGNWRHFSPVSDFEKSLRVLSFKALNAALPLLKSNHLEDELEKQGLKVELYRPDFDPFLQTTGVERFFTDMLARDFKLDRHKKERDKRLAIVEQRIIEKSGRLPEIEKRNRRLKESRIGKMVQDSRLETLKKILKFLLNRD